MLLEKQQAWGNGQFAEELFSVLSHPLSEELFPNTQCELLLKEL